MRKRTRAAASRTENTIPATAAARGDLIAVRAVMAADTVAPVAALACLTVPKTAKPSSDSPAIFGFTPATKHFLPLP